MSHDKVTYWKKRAKNSLESTAKQVFDNVQSLEDSAKHINIDTMEISKAINNLIKAYKKLDEVFSKAEVKK